MKSILSTLALLAALGVAGHAAAEDAMATPMQDNAMSSGAMATDAMAPDAMMMTPDQMLAACMEKAGMAADAMMQADDKKMCQGAYDILMGDQATMSTPMANDAMAGAAMAPAQ